MSFMCCSKWNTSKWRIAPNLDWRHFWKFTFFKFIGIALATFIYVWFFDHYRLFEAVVNKPGMWALMLLVYCLLSVYPQELVYRTFFFQRYRQLLSNEAVFLLANALAFSVGHIFFNNALVLLMTFLGGLMFALTYSRTKSTLLVSIEHAIYGCWLHTVGMGAILGFPV